VSVQLTDDFSQVIDSRREGPQSVPRTGIGRVERDVVCACVAQIAVPNAMGIAVGASHRARVIDSEHARRNRAGVACRFASVTRLSLVARGEATQICRPKHMRSRQPFVFGKGLCFSALCCRPRGAGTRSGVTEHGLLQLRIHFVGDGDHVQQHFAEIYLGQIFL
jgi:hypothetical protein